MNALQRLLSLSDDEKTRLGVEATPAEIAQQPEMWRDTARRFAEASAAVRNLLAQVGLPGPPTGRRAGSGAEIVFGGAGTSDFVGRCVEGPVSEALATRAIACPTTTIVTHPQYAFGSDRPAVMVSFARSGNSPESVAAVEMALQGWPQVRHLIITCDETGQLAHLGREHGDKACVLVLHPRTNDRGLAMTSSFTSMVVAGLGLAYLDHVDDYAALVNRMAEAGERILQVAPDVAELLAKKKPRRACFLGSGALEGAAVECHLKLQELTDGDVICLCDSFLGLRHGPRAAIHGDTLVIYFLSSDPHVRRYEMDLLRSNRQQGIGLAHLVVVDQADAELRSLADELIEFDPEGELRLPDHMKTPVVTIAGQLLGVFASLELGLKPDTPSRAGVIHRVVQGVTIYPWRVRRADPPPRSPQRGDPEGRNR